MNRIFLVLLGLASLSFSGSVEAREFVPGIPASSGVIMAKAEAGKIRQMTGVVLKLDLASGKLELKNKRGEKSFKIVKETQVKKGRDKIKLEHLRPGTRVVVKYRDLGEVKQARIIKLQK